MDTKHVGMNEHAGAGVKVTMNQSFGMAFASIVLSVYTHTHITPAADRNFVPSKSQIIANALSPALFVKKIPNKKLADVVDCIFFLSFRLLFRSPDLTACVLVRRDF